LKGKWISRMCKEDKENRNLRKKKTPGGEKDQNKDRKTVRTSYTRNYDEEIEGLRALAWRIKDRVRKLSHGKRKAYRVRS